MQIEAKKEKLFKIVQGSNYLVVDSYGNEYVITFDHFQALSRSLFTGSGDFTTINNAIINKKYIYKIEPTNRRTEAQKKEIKNSEKKEFEKKYLN